MSEHDERTYGDSPAAITLYWLLRPPEAFKFRRQISKLFSEYNGALRAVAGLTFEDKKKTLYLVDAAFHFALHKLDNVYDNLGSLKDHRAYTYARCILRTTHKKYRCVFHEQERDQAIEAGKYQPVRL